MLSLKSTPFSVRPHCQALIWGVREQGRAFGAEQAALPGRTGTDPASRQQQALPAPSELGTKDVR